jgi:RNA polymerase sigma-70 factor (ECF subfamily)
LPEIGQSPVNVTSTDNLSDFELVRQLAHGDRDALAIVFRRHQAMVFRFSKQMLGTREAAEDLTQEVFIELARGASRYDESRGALGTYLYGIARNLILQRYKRRRLQSEISIDSLAEDSAPLTTSSDPLDKLMRAQLLRRLRTAILQLPIHYREVIVLCELNGLSYEDAALVANCPVGTIRSRLSRARALLISRCKKSMTSDETPEAYPTGLRLAKHG